MAVNATADASFGPKLEGQFDFTLLFEQSIFLIGPSALFVVVASVRVAVLASGKPGAWKTTTLWGKLVSCQSLDCLSVCLSVCLTLTG